MTMTEKKRAKFNEILSCITKEGGDEYKNELKKEVNILRMLITNIIYVSFTIIAYLFFSIFLKLKLKLD